MKKQLHRYIFLIFLLNIFLGAANAQINANWQLTGPVKFPTLNGSGQINGIGRATQIVFHPSNPNKMYATGASGGLYISTDGANTWQVTGTDKLPDMQCASACVDYTNDQILYLGSGDPNYYSTGYGIWKSTDGGATWKLSNTGIGNRLALNIFMDPANNKVLVAATNDGIWKSTDAGANWSVKKSGGAFRQMIAKPNDPKILYAVTSSAFFRSADMGDTWTQITISGSGISGSGCVGVSKADPNRVYVTFVGSAGACTPVYRSNDAGLTFTIAKPANAYNMNGYTESQTGQGAYNYAMTVDPLNANNVWVCGHCVFKSTDGGVNWTRKTSWTSIMHTDMHQIVYSPLDATKLFDANDGGVWMNTDAGAGVKWAAKSDGFSCTENYHGAQSPIKKDRMSCGTQDNGEIYYDAGNWYTNRGGDWGEHIVFDCQNADWIYYYGNNPATGRRRTSLTGGEQQLNFPFTTNNTSHHLMEFTPLQKNVAFITDADVWRTDNLTSNPPTWKKISGFNDLIRGLCISPADANVMYAVATSGKIYRSDNALSASPSFTNVSTVPTAASSKGSVAVIKSDPNVVYIHSNGKVYRSADKGVTWADVSAGLPATTFIKMYHDIYSKDEGVYIANGAGAVYYKNKNLTSWVNYSKGLPTICNVTNFMIYNDGNYKNSVLRVSYYGRGVWETPLYDPSTVDVNEIAGNDIYSLSIFPNPSKESASISFVTSQTGNAELAIYDMQGKMVKAVMNTLQLSPGEHTYPVDISALEPGAYTCKLIVDGVVKSKIVVKE